jgi:hypothetical protein
MSVVLKLDAKSKVVCLGCKRAIDRPLVPLIEETASCIVCVLRDYAEEPLAHGFSITTMRDEIGW